MTLTTAGGFRSGSFVAFHGTRGYRNGEYVNLYLVIESIQQ